MPIGKDSEPTVAEKKRMCKKALVDIPTSIAWIQILDIPKPSNLISPESNNNNINTKAIPPYIIEYKYSFQDFFNRKWHVMGYSEVTSSIKVIPNANIPAKSAAEKFGINIT